MAGAAEESASRPRDIADAIARLGSEDFNVRENASRYLWSVGKAAVPQLREALHSRDPEVVHRANRVLENFRFGILPDTPPDVAAILADYRDADSATRITLLDGVANPPTSPQLRALLTLATIETDVELKNAITHRIGIIPVESVIHLLADGETVLAEQVLAYAAGSENPAGAQHFAALLVASGNLKKRIAGLEAGEGSSEKNVALLGYLQRVHGDLAAARERCGVDKQRLKQICLQQNDWRALAELFSDELGEGPAAVEQLGILASCQRLAGLQKSETTLARIRQTGNESDDEGLVRRCARMLMINDRPGEALELLIEKEVLDDAFEVLCAQNRYDEALALIERVQRPSPMMARLKLAMAGVLKDLGEDKRALALLNDVSRQYTVRPHYDVLALLMKTERKLGQRDALFEHCLAALQVNPNANPQELFDSLFASDEPKVQTRRVRLAMRWWTQLQHSMPEDIEARLRTLRRIVDQSMPPEELEALAVECTLQAEQASSANNSDDHGQCLALLADTWLDRGRRDKAQECLETAVRAGQNSEEALMSLGDLAAGQKQWVRAAELYRQSWERDRTFAAALYLRGWALSQAGQARAGKICMERACLLPLADESRRNELRLAFERLDHVQMMRQQDDLMSRVGEFGSAATARFLKARYDTALDNSEFQQAAATKQTLLIHALMTESRQDGTAGALSDSCALHALEARAMLKRGDTDAAMREAAHSLELMPGSVEWVVALVTELQEQGKSHAAQSMLEMAMAAQNKVLARYPGSQAHQQNVRKLQALSGELTASQP